MSFANAIPEADTTNMMRHAIAFLRFMRVPDPPAAEDPVAGSIRLSGVER
jgi:hypothetical protein